MKKNLFLLLFALSSFISPHTALSQNYTITVTITGLHSNKGKITLFLFSSEEGYPQDHSKAFRTVNNTITNNTCTIILGNIPKGAYAIGYFHDENDNGKLDTNFLGIPDEGVGASNNAKGFMGPPKFKDAKFIVDTNISMFLKITY